MLNIPFFVGFVLICTVSGPAQAQTSVQTTESDCSQFVTHVAAAEVAYRSGVDVNGNAVAPADLNGQPQVAVPDVISVAVTNYLATNPGIDTSFLPRPTVGEVQITRDGRVTFNGQPINGYAQQELAKRCQHIGTAN